MLLGRYKTPHAHIQIQGLPGLASREIGNRITVTETASGLNASEWFIVGIQDTFQTGWKQNLACVEASMLGVTSDSGSDWFVIGHTKYGAAGANDGPPSVNHGHLWS
jgi:hypothetical protein